MKKPNSIIVVASRWDEAAATSVERWANANACLLTPDDLSEPGWRYRPGSAGDSRAVVSGQLMDATRIAGVLVRLPAVSEQEIARILPEHRAYVAAEMHAFLTAWLTELPCAVYNRPTSGCLAGPAWRPEQWTHVAARLGIPVVPIFRMSDGNAGEIPDLDAEHVTVTVIGGSAVGSSPATLRKYTLELAEAAGVEMLSARFTDNGAGPRFVGASLWPDILDDSIADALLSRLLEARGTTPRKRVAVT